MLSIRSLVFSYVKIGYLKTIPCVMKVIRNRIVIPNELRLETSRNSLKLKGLSEALVAKRRASEAEDQGRGLERSEAHEEKAECQNLSSRGEPSW